MAAIDPGVEERDGDAAAVLVPERHTGPLGESGGLRRREGGRIRDAHGIDAGHLRRALEQGDPPCVERRGESVDRARVAELGLSDDTLNPQPRDQEPLRRERSLRPLALLLVGRKAADAPDSVRERGRLEDDDHALADRYAHALRAGEPTPRRLRAGASAAASPSQGDQHGRDPDRDGR